MSSFCIKQNQRNDLYTFYVLIIRGLWGLTCYNDVIKQSASKGLEILSPVCLDKGVVPPSIELYTRKLMIIYPIW